MHRSTGNSNAGHRAQKLKASKGAVPCGRSTRATTRKGSANVETISRPEIVGNDESVKTPTKYSTAGVSPAATSPPGSATLSGFVKSTSGKDNSVKENSAEDNSYKGVDYYAKSSFNKYKEQDPADKGDAAVINKNEDNDTGEVSIHGSFTSTSSESSADSFNSEGSFETDATETSLVDNIESVENRFSQSTSENFTKSGTTVGERLSPEDNAKETARTKESRFNCEIPEDVLNIPLDNSSDEEDLESEFQSDSEDEDTTSDCSDSDEDDHEVDENDLTIRDDDFVLTFTTAHLADGFKVSTSPAVPPPFAPGSPPQLPPAKKYKLSKLMDFRSRPLKLKRTPLIPFEALFSETDYSSYLIFEEHQESFFCCLLSLRLALTNETVVHTDPTIPNDPSGFYQDIASFYGTHSGQYLPHDHPLARICPQVTTDGSWYQAAIWRWKPRETRALDWLSYSFPQASVFELHEQRKLCENPAVRPFGEAGLLQYSDLVKPDEVEECNEAELDVDEDIEEIIIDDASLQLGWKRLPSDEDEAHKDSRKKSSHKEGEEINITITITENSRKRAHQVTDSDTDEEYEPGRPPRTSRKRCRREHTPELSSHRKKAAKGSKGGKKRCAEDVEEKEEKEVRKKRK